MDAIILAAGFGTRLRPITDHRPKALVEVNNETLLGINIKRLKHHGIRRIIVNVHHFADMIEDYLSSRQWGVEIVVSDERDMLLDTGGALKQAIPLCHDNSPILVHNVDVLSTIDIESMLNTHRQQHNDVTLAVCRRNTARQLLIDNSGCLQGWSNSNTGETQRVDTVQRSITPVAFSGITILQPSFADLLPDANHPYPIIPQYLANAANCRVGTFIHREDQWLDVGKPETLALAERIFNRLDNERLNIT